MGSFCLAVGLTLFVVVVAPRRPKNNQPQVACTARRLLDLVVDENGISHGAKLFLLQQVAIDVPLGIILHAHEISILVRLLDAVVLQNLG
jgi:hypothetical protein